VLEIYRIDHVSQVVPELEPQRELLEALFGFTPVRTWDGPEEGLRGARYAVAPGENWEVLAPTGPDSEVQAFLDRQGGRPGFHHVAVEVPDLDTARRELDDRGIALTAGGSGGWIEASLSPPEAGPGVLFRISGPGEHTLCGDDPRGDVGVAPLAASEDALGVVAIDHVCQAYADRDELARWYRELAGFVEVWRTPVDKHPDMADLVLNVPGSRICWEVIMPRGEDSFIQRFLDRSGPGAHHVTMEVADWDRAMHALKKREIEPFGSSEGQTDGAAWLDTFLHPKLTGGILVQLFWEQRPGVWVRSDKIPPRQGR
jgi:methylmalonyl-CoA epimerase